MKEQTKEFTLPVIIPPGEHIQELLEERGWIQKELATRMGRPVQAINQIINGKKAITAETAIQLEEVLGMSAKTWMNLESSYRLALARKKQPQLDLPEQIFLKWLRNYSSEGKYIEAVQTVNLLLAESPTTPEHAFVTELILNWLEQEPERVQEIARRMNARPDAVDRFRRLITKLHPIFTELLVSEFSVDDEEAPEADTQHAGSRAG